MDETLKLIEELNGLIEQSNEIKAQAMSKKKELEEIRRKERNKIADKNIKRFTKLIEKANIRAFTSSFTFEYSSSFGKDDYHVFFSKDGAYQLDYENLFYCRLGGHSSYSKLFTLDGKINETYPLGEKGAKTFLFVEHYEELEKDLVDALRKSIDTKLKESSEETAKADKIAKDIDSLRNRQ